MAAVSLNKLYLLLIIIQIIRVTLSANILAFYPFPGVSHHRVYWPLLRELAVRGHNVTMVSPFSMENPPKNYKEIKVKDYSKECRELEENSFIKESNPFVKMWKNANLFMLREMGLYHTEIILQDKNIQWLIASDSTFDIIIGEFSFAEESYIALSHRFQASYIEVTSFGNYHWSNWIYGNPIDTSYIADISTPYGDNMNLFGRFHNTVFSVTYRFVWYYYYIPKFQALADSYIRYPGWQQRPSISEMLSSNTSMVLVNTHFSLNYPYPLAPNYKEIGGINIGKTDTKLPKDIQEFINGANDGVIYFSMGSYLMGSSTLTPKMRDDFIKVFSRLKQRVLWKWETDIPNLPNNVKISKWMPQPAILAHPKCKLFISHVGFLSVSETIDKAVPVLALPIFADQPRNAKFITSKGIGISLDFANITETSISWGINEILNNIGYKERALKQSKIYRDKPETALETAVFWTEYVIRHNGAHHLRPALATMPWYQQSMIDVYAVLALIIITPIIITIKLMSCLLNLVCRCGRKKIKDKQKTH